MFSLPLKDKFHWLFLITIPLFFILDACNQFWGLIPLSSIFKITILLILVSYLIFIVFRKYFGIEKSALIMIWGLMFFLYYKSIIEGFLSFQPFSFFRQNKLYLGLLLLVSIGFLILIFKSSLRNLKKASLYLNLLFFIIVILEIVKSIEKTFEKPPLVISTNKLLLSPIQNTPPPNIYLIVMDEYAGIESLKKNHGFDNTEFVNSLLKRKFFVSKNPNSNYNGTAFSLLSLLDMGYLNNFNKKDIESVTGYGEAVKAIQKNQLTDFLQKNGYHIVNNSCFKINGTNANSILFLPIEDRLAMDKTLGNALWHNLLSNIPSNRIQSLLKSYGVRMDNYNQKIIKNAEIFNEHYKNPVFIYTHLLIPHHPYLRDNNGVLRNFSEAHHELDSTSRNNAYINYLKYGNGVVIKMIDSYLSKNSNSIVVLISDHGNRLVKSNNKKIDDFNIFLAIYNSQLNYSGFSDTTCLVNTFRIILNNHLSQKLPLLVNKRINVTEGVL